MNPWLLFWYVVALGAGLLVCAGFAGLACVVRTIYLAIVFTDEPKTKRAR